MTWSLWPGGAQHGYQYCRSRKPHLSESCRLEWPVVPQPGETVRTDLERNRAVCGNEVREIDGPGPKPRTEPLITKREDLLFRLCVARSDGADHRLAEH